MLHPGELSRLLNGNETPNAVESASIRHDLGNLKVQIARLEDQLKGLRGQERACHAILSPIRRVPAEVWGQIFLLSVSPVLDDSGRDALLDLSLVCWNWRNAACGTLRLWGGIKIFLYHTGRLSYDKIATWLGRSGTMPKTVEIRSVFGCRCPEMPCHSANPVFQRLVTEGPTLEHLKLPCKNANCFKNWINAIQSGTGPTPWGSLQSLHLAFSEETRWNDSTKASRSIFRHLPPTLTALHLQLPSVTRAFRETDDAYEAVLHIPSEILQRLKSLALFCDWHGMHVFDMLQHCTSLETLQLDTDNIIPWEGLEAAEELMENRLQVPKLRTLRFRRAAGIGLLDYVRAPALRHLDLGCTTAEAEGELDEEFAETLEIFILQSRLEKKLETLRIYDIYIDGEELGQTLVHLRNLRELTLDRVRMDAPWSFWAQFWVMKPAPGADVGACLPFLEQANLLHLPSKYPFIHIADFFGENKKRVHCQVNVSYEEGSQHTDHDFQDFPLRRAPVSFKLIPPVPLDESYFNPTGERDFV